MCDRYFASLRQGRVIVLDLPATLRGEWVIVSQSCDVVLAKREMIQLAPVVRLDEPEIRRGALSRENPRYPPIQQDGEPTFADLGKVTSLEKAAVSGADLGAGIDPDDEIASRNFGLAVGRWFSRFAFPDAVQPWLAPLQKLIREKYDRPSSPLGRVLQSVSEIRVQASDPAVDPSDAPNSRPWAAVPVDLTLHVVVDAGVLPTLDDEDEIDELAERRARAPKDLNQACDALLKSNDRLEKVALWDAVGAALAERCHPHSRHEQDTTVTSAVHFVNAQIWSDDEFPLSKYRKSEQLDVDFLSDPVPL